MKTRLLFSSFPFISSDKVTLSHITDLDIDALWEIMGDDENYRFSPSSAKETKTEVAAKLREFDAAFQAERAVVLGIYDNRKLNQLVGMLELSEFNPEIEALTLNIMLGKKYTGYGFASAAVSAAVKYLFESICVRRIQAYVMPTNYRAERMFERCGFVREGTIREGFLWPDKGIVDLTIYSMLPSDLKPKSTGTKYYL